MELIPLLTLGNSVYCSYLQPITLNGQWSQPYLPCSSTHPPSLLRFSITSLRNAHTEDISRSRYGSRFSVSINESPFLEPASRAPSVAFFLCPVLLLAKLRGMLNICDSRFHETGWWRFSCYWNNTVETWGKLITWRSDVEIKSFVRVSVNKTSVNRSCRIKLMGRK